MGTILTESSLYSAFALFFFLYRTKLIVSSFPILVTGKICLSNLNATLKLEDKDNCSQISSCVEVIHSRRKEHNLLPNMP